MWPLSLNVFFYLGCGRRVPWQGNADNMIDRFDVRANLDLIPDWHGSSSKNLAQEEEEANPGINYERYRILIQNDLSGSNTNFCQFSFLEKTKKIGCKKIRTFFVDMVCTKYEYSSVCAHSMNSL